MLVRVVQGHGLSDACVSDSTGGKSADVNVCKWQAGATCGVRGRTPTNRVEDFCCSTVSCCPLGQEGRRRCNLERKNSRYWTWLYIGLVLYWTSDVETDFTSSDHMLEQVSFRVTPCLLLRHETFASRKMPGCWFMEMTLWIWEMM